MLWFKKKDAIILAAGNSTRTLPLTSTRPKPLLKVTNKTLLEYNLDQLNGLVKNVVIVVGYKKEMIQDLIGNQYKKLKITYVDQKVALGTADAACCAEGKVGESFIVLAGDDIYSRDDIKRCLRYDYSILAKEVDEPQHFGVIEEKQGRLLTITEKPEKPQSNLANTGCYSLKKEIFFLLNQVEASKRGEKELVDAVQEIAKTRPVEVIRADFWMPTSYIWSLLSINEALLQNLKPYNKGNIESGATIKGDVQIGEDTLIKSGAYIEGPVVIGKNCVIGPNCYIRPFTSIGDECRIGNAVEIKNSILFDHAYVNHLSYVGDSVLGYNVNLGAGTKVANLRHDGTTIKSKVKGSLIDTKRKKFGAIICDGVKTGVNTAINPGRQLGPQTTTHPNETIATDRGV